MGRIAPIASTDENTRGPSERDRVYREVKTIAGVLRCYWVCFEEPQWDEEQDGPYVEAEVPEEFLERV
jgi:hypothetical protein